MFELQEIQKNEEKIRIFGIFENENSLVTDQFVSKWYIYLRRNDYIFDRRDEPEPSLSYRRNIILKYKKTNQKEAKKEEDSMIFYLLSFPSLNLDAQELIQATPVIDGLIFVFPSTSSLTKIDSYIRYSITHKVKPILFLDNIFDLILNPDLDLQKTFQILSEIIDNFNHIISSCLPDFFQNFSLDPIKGNVVFGSSPHSFGFTIEKFASFYNKRFFVNQEKLTEKLWGKKYWNQESKKFTSKNTSKSGKQLRTTFAQFVLEPLLQFLQAIKANEKEKVRKMCGSLGIKIQYEDLEIEEPNRRIRRIMEKFINLAETLGGAVSIHLPSPKQAQKYRVENFYTGPLNDPNAEAICDCDPNGPLFVYVWKWTSIERSRNFAFFARIFSGNLKMRQKVNKISANYKLGERENVTEKTIQRIFMFSGWQIETISDCLCGNLVCIQEMYDPTSPVTLTDFYPFYPFKTHSFHNQKVMKIQIEPSQKDLQKITDFLRKETRLNPYLSFETDDTRAFFSVESPNKEMIEDLIEKLKKQKQIEYSITKLRPIYRETIQKKSTFTSLAISPNKHNKIYMNAEPIPSDHEKKISKKFTKIKDALYERNALFIDELGWSQTDTQRIWDLGSDSENPLLIVDKTSPVLYLNETKDYFNAALNHVSKGILCNQKLKGVQFNIIDAILHSDSIHRGGGQLIPTIARVIKSSFLSADPKIMEPFFNFRLEISPQKTQIMKDFFSQNQNVQLKSSNISDCFNSIFEGVISVQDSFDFKKRLSDLLDEYPILFFDFDSWRIVEGEIWDINSKAYSLITELRKENNLEIDIPTLESFLNFRK
ncbi:eukaryotic translation elongation factor 2a tandem duplicate 1-related [Anaeramoeba ignava]|uniref:Eukaryotic translation elongation factor 2a tandem duplicate 1-related n=1 Tax=Anaeramoeba ignava TaxID=1746090 RepID=A0A9Q0LEH8_ANAIG|nr:eukaryotic translation elongation factor 2a tandem duplicate 1-related [Anaeramoeba ignava]